MQPSAQRAYLTTQVMTATPQKLQLMLVDAAIRSANQAKLLWSQDENERAGEALIHCQSVIGELLASLRTSGHELAGKLAAVYVFVFRTLTEAHLERSATKLDEVLSVLEVERETWRQICEKFGTQMSDDPSVPDQPKATFSGKTPIAAAEPFLLPHDGISFEA